MRHYVRRALTSVATLVAAAVIFTPSAGHAQSGCTTELHDQSSGIFKNGDTVCQGAVNGKCSFSLALCVNQGTGCTPQDLKKKKIKTKVKGNCSKKLTVKANGTTATCGTSGMVTVKTKKKKTQAGSCTVKVKAGTDMSTVTLDCEPQASSCPSTTTTTSTSTTTTTTAVTCTPGAPCSCGASAPTQLAFTTTVGSGNCGTISNAAGAVTKNLACGGLFTGGGSNTVPLPYAVPDMGTSLTGIAACNGTCLTFTNLDSAQTGSNRNCTSVGCLFGPPLPIPNTMSTPTSVCVINTVATNASGTGDCSTGVSNLSLPLSSGLYLSGDLLPARPGIQVCPICVAAACVGGANNGVNCGSDTDCPGGTCALSPTCHGGANNGMACTPADSPVNGSFPTSHDCPPAAGDFIGSLPIAFDLSTGTQKRTAVNNPGQNNVFCGFCRDINGPAGSGCFEGDPGGACPPSAAPKPCTSNADCDTDFPDCQQRNPGAFGPAGGAAHTITETGSPAGSLTDHAGHASTLVSIFCIQPTFNPTVDAAGDLPGPGAVALSGTAQLQ